MIVVRNLFGSGHWVVLLLLSACGPKDERAPEPAAEPTVTNRLEAPPEVVGNLGITFEKATRGRLGVWRKVSGQLEVPENRRWTLRAPARGRLLSVVPRWQIVKENDVIATLTSPELQDAQRSIALSKQRLESVANEVVAARARLAESETHVGEARDFESASRDRLEELRGLNEGGNALTSRELIEARRTVTDAGKASLEAAMARDELAALVARKELEAEQARLSTSERLNALAVLTGRPVSELSGSNGNDLAWKKLETLVVRSPAAGVVVELSSSQGETVEQGAEIARIFDTRQLRFRGRLPEGDLGELSAGNRVKLEFPARQLKAIETKLDAPLPVADEVTRMIHVRAPVPNPGGELVPGLSVMAQVLVRESQNEEILIPSRCVVFDGLEAIVFRRDPEDPNVVIRTPVELGERDAGQVEVLAGVLDGDALVADGVQQLKQTGLGKTPEGGHVHADGTWHDNHE